MRVRACRYVRTLFTCILRSLPTLRHYCPRLCLIERHVLVLVSSCIFSAGTFPPLLWPTCHSRMSAFSEYFGQIIHLEKNDTRFFELLLNLPRHPSCRYIDAAIPQFQPVVRCMRAADKHDVVPPRQRRATRRADAKVALQPDHDQLGVARHDLAQPRAGERIVLALVEHGLAGEGRVHELPAVRAGLVGVA